MYAMADTLSGGKVQISAAVASSVIGAWKKVGAGKGCAGAQLAGSSQALANAQRTCNQTAACNTVQCARGNANACTLRGFAVRLLRRGLTLGTKEDSESQ